MLPLGAKPLLKMSAGLRVSAEQRPSRASRRSCFWGCGICCACSGCCVCCACAECAGYGKERERGVEQKLPGWYLGRGESFLNVPDLARACSELEFQGTCAAHRRHGVRRRRDIALAVAGLGTAGGSRGCLAAGAAAVPGSGSGLPWALAGALAGGGWRGAGVVAAAGAGDEHHQAGGVGVGDGVGGGVGVPVELLGAGGFQEGVGADEPAGDRIVGPGADDGQPGSGVGGLVQEPAVVDPGGRGAPRRAVGGELPPGRDLRGVVQRQYRGAARAGDLEPVAGPGPGAVSDPAAGQRVVPDP